MSSITLKKWFLVKLSPAQWLATGLGAIIFGLAALLSGKPAGLSQVTLELQANNVWSPDVFTAIWRDSHGADGVEWQAPFRLPGHAPLAATLVITAAGSGQAGAGAEVWLAGAVWPDGQAIPFDQFQAGPGWQEQTITWGDYQDRPVLVFRQGSPAALHWQGFASGPLTLVFAAHERAGQVTVGWNDQVQTLDLRATGVEFRSLILPATGPVVWRAKLPASALAGEIGLTVQPDPTGGFPAVLTALGWVSGPGQGSTVTGEALLQAFRFDEGGAIPVQGGIKLAGQKPGQPPRALLAGPLAPKVPWSRWLPLVENGLLGLAAAGLGGLVAAFIAKRLPAPWLTNLNLVAISLLATLGLGEVVLQTYLPPIDKYYVWPPGLHAIFNPDPAVLPGVEGETNFIINSQGLRGDEPPAGAVYRILTIGGSTTECLYLDQTEAWPQRLQTYLNDALPGQQVWVGNAGKSGLNTRENLLQMEYLLPQHPEIDAVLLLVGGNDFNLRLIEGDSYKPNYLDLPGAKRSLLQRAFSVRPTRDPNLHFYRLSAVWRLLARIDQAQTRVEQVDEIDTEDNAGHVYAARRARRQKATLTGVLPDLREGVAEYRRNLNRMIDLAQAHGVRLVVMTQPTMWRPDLNQAETELLWLGWQPGHEIYYTPGALADGMASYNETTLEVCRTRQIECFDLAAALPQDTSVFYDDLHFNESGAQQVAGLVVEYLLDRPPLEAAR